MRIGWMVAGAMLLGWWQGLLWVLVAFVAFWLWMFVGSSYHCPQCGRSLELGAKTPLNIYRDSCSCGWRRD